MNGSALSGIRCLGESCFSRKQRKERKGNVRREGRMNKPLFSCVMPVKGKRPFFGEAIDSLRAQGLGDQLEIILQDGDSRVEHVDRVEESWSEVVEERSSSILSPSTRNPFSVA